MPRRYDGRMGLAGAADVAVLGAGLTGATAALELARAGVDVVLIDRDAQPMNRASLRNEGKIHLGYVFAHDRTLATARLMIEGALRFRSILSRLIGAPADALQRSHPFTYLVHEDSLLGPDELEGRFLAIAQLVRARAAADAEFDYLGRVPRAIVRRCSVDARTHIDGARIAAAFDTDEVAIDTHELAHAVRAAVAAEPRIRFVGGHTVDAVDRSAGGFVVCGTSEDGSSALAAGSVVNATWEDRFRLDRTAGLVHPPGWLHRLKYRVIARLPEHMRDGPSVTMVVGPFGDVVVRPDGTAYFSWYPVGLRGWTDAPAPPAAWNAPCRGEIPPERARALATALLGAIDAWYPGAAQAVPLAVDAGAIVAYGRTDVDDPESGLHDRTRVGVTSCAGYHSVDPGKLTTAPLFGVRAAHAVLAERAFA